MKKISDSALKEKIQKRKAELDSLLALEQERIKTRRSKLGEYLETNMLLFQFYYNYKLSEQLNYLNNQVSMLHTLYKGESKYWFDTSNKKLYVETKKQHDQSNKK